MDCRDGKGWPPLLYAHFVGHEASTLELMKENPGQVGVGMASPPAPH